MRSSEAAALNVDEPEELVQIAIDAVARGVAQPLGPAEVRTLLQELGRFGHAAEGRLLRALDQALTHPEAAAVLAMLHGWGLIALWLPEVAAMDGLHRDAVRHHKDLWAHTLQVIGQTPADRDLRWVALCHDIGKPSTRFFSADQVSFWRHESVGAWLFDGIAARLRMPEARRLRVRFVIEHHARTNQYRDGWSDKALRRLIRDSGPYLADMIAFSRSDWSTRRQGRVASIHAGLDRLEARLGALATAPASRPAAPSGLAAHLLEATGRAPGPWIGEALGRVGEAIASGRLPPEPTLEACLAFVVAEGQPGQKG